jgi:L-Ala-D/L-Glu epimerase
MKLKFYPYTLQLKHVFTVALYSRTTTPVVMVELEHEGVVGYGEASMPPYLGESQESVTNFLRKVNLDRFNDPFQTEQILLYIDSIEEGNNAAKAAVDIALHDLTGKLLGEPLYRIWGLNSEDAPLTSYTVGIDTKEMVRQKVTEASDFRIIKVKLGGENDKEMIETIREVTDVPLTVDANQGWKDKHLALEMIEWVKERGVLFVEQPMPKDNIEDMYWLTERSPLPTIADESCKRLGDVIRMKDAFTGINIKLMKSTGLREAHKMILTARGLGMKVMLGCMTETSCAVTAAAQLSPMVDWADLDGAALISNDLFEGIYFEEGKVKLPNLPGIGILKREAVNIH